MKNEPEFTQRVKMQKVVMRRVQQIALKQSVGKAHRGFVRRQKFSFKNSVFRYSFNIIITIVGIALIAYAVWVNNKDITDEEKAITTKDTTTIQYRFIPLAEHFGYPLGSTYFNSIEGGGSDLGDTIYSIGNGVVSYSSDALLNIMHRTTDTKIPIITSIYDHCDTLFVRENEIVKAGQSIALVGKKDTDVTHLHFEITTDTSYVGGFYDNDTTGFINPVTFIDEHR